MRRDSWIVAFTACVCLAVSVGRSAVSAEAGSTTLPNVVLIISDDHGWTDYGFMGHQQVRTPNLDRLASQSLVFRRGHVPSSLCCPSLASMITGLYPHQHKITCNDPPIPPGLEKRKFPASDAFRAGRDVMIRHLESVPSLPRLLGGKGYVSLQTGKWWLGDYRHGGFTEGMTRGQRHGDEGLDIGRKTMQPIFDFVDAAKREGKPFFVWYAPMMPHDPHTPPERLLQKYSTIAPSATVAKYWAMVDWFDESCGQLLDHLDRQKLSDNTIVVYLADNGWVQNPAGNGPLRSKLTQYEAGLRTPIMIRWPGKVAPAMSDELAISVDIAPTILKAIGIAPTTAMQGVNLLDDRAVRDRRAICGTCYSHNFVDLNQPARNVLWRWIIQENWKLIVPSAQASSHELELYDVVTDPHEQKNLAAEQPDRVKSLRQQLDAWWNPE